jgi:aminoglycoside phosphotransferase (APT) family kinase protein
VALTAVRSEDAFNVEAVHEWLRGLSDVPAELPQVGQFSSGASNLTYQLDYPDGRQLVLRRPPMGHKAAAAHDMAREYRIQSAVRPAFRLVPAMVGLCEAPEVLGDPFYVMEKVPGRILGPELPVDVAFSSKQAAALGRQFVGTLVDLHSIDVQATGLADLGRGDDYVRRQVQGWTERFQRARTSNVPDFSGVCTWLRQQAPDDVASRLIHNDFRLDNLVLDDSWHVRAVLDWEMATVGDPLMDLGCALAYWVQADDDEVFRLSRRQPSDLPGMPSRKQLVALYAVASGLCLADWDFYEVFGLFRLAAIAQQIYYRYERGQTTNPAFRDFWVFVAYLEQRCTAVAGLG